jgi:serine/threonine-protein kinase
MTSDLRARLDSALDGYRIDRQVAEGGMAIVFLAEDLKHDRQVALKVMKPDLGGAEARKRFTREIGIAAKLSHPHVLPLYDSGEADGIHYIVMPFVEDESLLDRLARDGALPLRDAVRITSEIASGLDYAHGRGLVHRDIKPANILLQSGHATVTDFGIARLVEDDESTGLTITGTTLGTYAYMSPEQATGEADVDGRADVYALGCVLFEVLEGEPLFKARTPHAVLASKVSGQIPASISSARVPQTVATVIRKALAPDPGDRYATPGELARELETAVSAEAIEAAAARSRSARRARVLGAAAAVVLVGALGVGLVRQLGGPAIERVAVLPFENERDDPSQAFLIDGMHDALITEMGQAGLAVIGRRSVMQYRDDDSPVREIASQLDVDVVIESFASYGADSVALRLRMVDGSTEAGIWSAEFGSPTSGVIRLYRQVTSAIAEEIGFELSDEAAMRLASAPSVDPAAYEAYMNGKGHWNRLAPEDLELARQYFERALTIAPDYALGHVGIAVLWGGLQQMGLVPPDEAAPRAREAVSAALAADSTIAEAHFAKAGLHTWTDWEWEEGESSFLRAIELNPSYAEARIYYAHLLMHLNRHDEALEQARLAVEMEPVSPLIRSLRCVVTGLAKRYELALTQCQEVLARDPRQIVARDGRTNALLGLERWDEYVENEITRARELGFNWLADILERSYPAEGLQAVHSEAADSMLARASRGEFMPPAQLALYLGFGDRHEEALDWLERAFELHDPSLPYMVDIPWPAEMTSGPRFYAVFDRMGLPPRD